jgi:SAM-dependent methyltransferase
MIFDYKGKLYPDYLKTGNACRFILPAAQHFCVGEGLDVGAGAWPFPGAIPVEEKNGGNAFSLPEGQFDYIFSSHCLEHLISPIAALKHWKTRLKPGGVLFLYLPHPDMEYWLPQNCEKHLHKFDPDYMAKTLRDLGFKDVIHSERDIAWGFAVVGFNG